MRRGVIMLIFFGGLAFLFGWITAYETFTIPGIYLASQIGIPALLAIVLAGTGRILQRGIADPNLAEATAALPRAARWALLVFWLFFTFTTVWQLAVSLALAILAFQLYASWDRLRHAGHPGFGPGLRITAIPLAAYGAWLLVFATAGSTIPSFDLLSLIGAYTFCFFLLRSAKKVAENARLPQAADATAAPAATAPARGATAKHLLVAVIVGYLFFRFFVSAHIPYGPIVEWFIISFAALFFTIVAAARIGTVPTARSLPLPQVRTHRQRVWSLPDQHISRVEKHLATYIRGDRDHVWVRTHYQALLTDSGFGEEEIQHALSELGSRRTTETERRQTILQLTRLLDQTHAKGDDAITDNVKTPPGVARPNPDPSTSTKP